MLVVVLVLLVFLVVLALLVVLVLLGVLVLLVLIVVLPVVFYPYMVLRFFFLGGRRSEPGILPPAGALGAVFPVSPNGI